MFKQAMTPPCAHTTSKLLEFSGTESSGWWRGPQSCSFLGLHCTAAFGNMPELWTMAKRYMRLACACHEAVGCHSATTAQRVAREVPKTGPEPEAAVAGVALLARMPGPWCSAMTLTRRPARRFLSCSEVGQHQTRHSSVHGSARGVAESGCGQLR